MERENEVQGERSDIPVVEGIQGENQKGNVIAEGVTGEKQVGKKQATPMEIETDIPLFQRMGTLLSQYEDLSRNLCNCFKKGISTGILAVEEKQKLQLKLQELKEQIALQEKKIQELEARKIKERRIGEELKKENSSLEAKVKTLKMEEELIRKKEALLKDQLESMQNSIDKLHQSTIFLSGELHIRRGKLVSAKKEMDLMQREQDDLKVEVKMTFKNAIYTGNLYRALYLEGSEEIGTPPAAEFPKPLPEGSMYV